MEITKDGLLKTLAAMEEQSQMAFANYHRVQAVIAYIKAQLEQLSIPDKAVDDNGRTPANP